MHYECSINSLRVNLTVCLFSKVSIVGSALEPMICLDIGFLLLCWCKNEGVGFILWSDTEVQSESGSNLMFKPMLQQWRCLARPLIIVVQASQIGKTDDDVSPLGACIAPSDTMRASSQDETPRL